MADSSIPQGGTFEFTVVAKNKFGDVIPVTDANVQLADGSLGTVGVNTDGSDGVFTSTDGLGMEEMTPSAGGVTGTPYTVEITQDLTVASVELVAAAPTSVTIQRRGAPLIRRR